MATRGKQNGHYLAGPQVIPGRVQAAYFDLGAEGVAYRDTDKTNHRSGELNYKYPHPQELGSHSLSS